MASIWTDIELEFKNKTYTVRPTLSLINSLEQGVGNSLGMMAYRASQGDLPIGVSAEFIAKVINDAETDPKKKVTPEDVLEESSDVSFLMTTVRTILTACLPSARETGATKAGKKKRKSTAEPNPTSDSSTE